MGISTDINDKRDEITIYVSINDGFYTIDCETIKYKIVHGGSSFKVMKDLKTIQRICDPGINCYSIALEGKIEIPGDMQCLHIYEEFLVNLTSGDVKKKDDEFSHKSQMENIMDYRQDRLYCFKRLGLTGTQDVLICLKCKKVKITNLQDKLLGLNPNNDDMIAFANTYETKADDCNFEIMEMVNSELADAVIFWIGQYLDANSMKLVAIGMHVSLYKYPVAISKFKRRIWVDFDAYPCFFSTTNKSIEYVADSFARKASALIGFDNIVRLCIGPYNKVRVDAHSIDFCSLADYQDYLFEYPGIIEDILDMTSQRNQPKNILELTSPEYLERLGIDPDADILRNKKIVFIGATPQGGGVALMRHAHMRFYKLLGMNVQWYVTIPVAQVYKITKTKFHNVLQGVSKEEITDEEIQIYEQWVELNSQRFWTKEVFATADIIVLDDHQTSGFVKHIRKANSNAKIIYRSHIQIRSELFGKNPAFDKTWKYISDNLKGIDMFVSHPLKNNVPEEEKMSNVVYIPPSTDPLDGLNKKMSKEIEKYYFMKFEELCVKYNQPILRQDASAELPCEDDEEKLEYKHCPYLVQVARFDPSKGIKDVITAFNKLYEHLGAKVNDPKSPHYNLKLVLIGHGSVDDPEGRTVYSETLEYIKQTGSKHIIAIQVPPSDQILNCILSNAKICLQLSVSEGFEIKVTESILKCVPVFVYDSGGLPLQVADGITGYVIPQGDTTTVANHLEHVLETMEFRFIMRNHIKYSKLLTTPFQIMAWLKIFHRVLGYDEDDDPNIYENMEKEYFKRLARRMKDISS